MEKIVLPKYEMGKFVEDGEEYKIAEDKDKHVYTFLPSEREIKKSIEALKNYQPSLEEFTIREIAEIIENAGSYFFDSDKYLDALSFLEITTGRAREVLKEDLEGLKTAMNEKYLKKIIEDTENGYKGIFDKPVSKFFDFVYKRRKPHGLVFHHLAGNSPMVSTSLIFGILTKNANLCKTGSGDPVTALYLADSIREAEEKLGKGFAVYYWPSSVEGELNSLYYAIFPENPAEVKINAVACWGGEESINMIRKLAHASGIKIIEHGPKYSMDILFELPENEMDYERFLKDSVISHDQFACTSTRIVFAFKDGEKLAENIAEVFEKLAEKYPNNSVNMGESIGKRIRYLKKGKLFLPKKKTPEWTVVYLPKEEKIALNDLDVCMGRFLIVKEVESLEEVSGFVKENNLERYLQVCAIYPQEKLSEEETIEKLWELGFSKISRIGEHNVFYPGASHDGVNELSEFTRYVTSDKHGIMQKLLKTFGI